MFNIINPRVTSLELATPEVIQEITLELELSDFKGRITYICMASPTKRNKYYLQKILPLVFPLAIKIRK